MLARKTVAAVAIFTLSIPIWVAPATAGTQIVPAQLPQGQRIIGLTTFSRMAVSADHVFVAEGTSGSQVAVMDLDGTQVHTIDNVPGPSGIATDGSTLYVSAMNASAIYVYDVASLPATKIDTLSTLPVESPTSLALAGGRLWFTGLDPSNDPRASLGSMTTSGRDVQAYYPPQYEYWQYSGGCGDISHSSFASNRLFVHGQGCGSPDVLYLYDASSAPPTRIAEYGLANWGSYNSQPATVLPDGSGAVVGYNNGLAVRSLDDLNGPVFSYSVPPGWSVGAAAVASTGTGLLAGSGSVAASRPGVVVWSVGGVTPVTAFQLPPPGGTYVARHGLAFSQDGSRLYAVVIGDGNVALHTIDPNLKGTSTSLEASTYEVTFGSAVTLQATLSGPGAGRQIVFRREVDGTFSSVGTCLTDVDGRCSVTTKATSNAKYRASFIGTTEWAASTSSNVSVSVGAWLKGVMLRAYGQSHNYSLYHEDRRIRYSVAMKPNRPGKKIVVSLEYNFGSGWKNGGSQGFKQGDDGRVTIYFASRSLPIGRYRLKARYSGDSLVLAGVSNSSYFRVTR